VQFLSRPLFPPRLIVGQPFQFFDAFRATTFPVTFTLIQVWSGYLFFSFSRMFHRFASHGKGFPNLTRTLEGPLFLSSSPKSFFELSFDSPPRSRSFSPSPCWRTYVVLFCQLRDDLCARFCVLFSLFFGTRRVLFLRDSGSLGRLRFLVLPSFLALLPDHAPLKFPPSFGGGRDR